ncbi:MAG: inorganic phosphate transporter [Candidatus Thermoplasmatota archaeon]|jgi:PiT family inorganic phosphate transporter|nr:inorganic phosphate transporter [Candidatus Thermoplasmatota archaeon]
MLLELVSLLLASVLTALVAGNNLSAAVGTLLGSRIVTRGFGVTLGIIGFSSGLLFEGYLMRGAAASLQLGNYYLTSYAFAGTIVIFLAAAYFRSPLSLTMALIGISTGIDISQGLAVDSDFLIKLVVVWTLAPVLLIILSFYINRATTSRPMENIWQEATILKILLVVVALLTGFTLGANTLGLIQELQGDTLLTEVFMVVAIAAGSIFLSGGVIKRVGEEIFALRYHNALTSLIVSSAAVEAATLVGIPLSNTQTLASSILGVGFSHRYKLLYTKPFLTVAATWVISPLAGLLLGLAAFII